MNNRGKPNSQVTTASNSLLRGPELGLRDQAGSQGPEHSRGWCRDGRSPCPLGCAGRASSGPASHAAPCDPGPQAAGPQARRWPLPSAPCCVSVGSAWSLELTQGTCAGAAQSVGGHGPWGDPHQRTDGSQQVNAPPPWLSATIRSHGPCGSPWDHGASLPQLSPTP